MGKPFRIRSKDNAVLLAKKLLRDGGDFSYHVPLLGGMEGGYVDIRCDKESVSVIVSASVHESDRQQKKGFPELVEHLLLRNRYPFHSNAFPNSSKIHCKYQERRKTVVIPE